ncbi:MAG: amidohydrolase/deacetylase family metallohydrolase [Puia sp.]|nr:amidohydrolase/deacetylase family metallohydrolase [Puia sp.]
MMRTIRIFLPLFIIFQGTGICLSFAQRTVKKGGVPPSDTSRYAILIKGGHVKDFKNHIDEVMDIAVNDGKVVSIAKHIDVAQAIQVVDAHGLYVMPGLIDIHEHVFYGMEPDHAYANGPEAIIPDGFTFRAGVTTIVDAGSSGWKSFATFKRQTIDKSQTRILAFLNIVGEGMRGGVYEQDTMDMNVKMAALTARSNRNIIVGFKVAHYNGHEWTPVDRAVQAGNMADVPVMIDFGGATPMLSIRELFMDHLRPGDIFTHCFGQLQQKGRDGGREAVVDIGTDQLKPFVPEAQKRGIVFDIGYGEISFALSQAIPAIKAGFLPNSISTDIHQDNVNAAMKDMLNVMSKLMAIGMPFDSVIKASTWNPAREIKREELGNLSVGAIADIAILNLHEGHFGFFDYTGTRVEGTRKLECEMTIKDGKIVYDLNGIANPVIAPRPSRANR